MRNPYTQAVKQVLRWIVQYRKFFEKNPKSLAYLMSFQDEMHYGSRHDANEELHDWENPKDAIMELEDIVGEEYSNLIYDAWAAQIHSRSNRKNGLALVEEGKLNKTLDDWVNICLNPKYRYNSHYPNRKQVLNYCLCAYGTGLDWNKDGFLTHIGPSGADEDVFFGYEKSFNSLPKEIKDKISKYRKDPIIKVGLKKMKQEEIEREKEDQAVKDIISGKLLLELKTKFKTEKDSKKKREMSSLIKTLESIKTKSQNNKPVTALFNEMCEYSPLIKMPKNAHQTYIAGGIEVCNLILANPKESKNGKNITVAKKFLKKWVK